VKRPPAGCLGKDSFNPARQAPMSLRSEGHDS
jgi:hypothetical protein